MEIIILTQNSTFIIGFVAKLLGLIMEGIFSLIGLIGLPNIGLAIILFTIVVNLLMLPLTIKQQKFSKLSAKLLQGFNVLVFEDGRYQFAFLIL